MNYAPAPIRNIVNEIKRNTRTNLFISNKSRLKEDVLLSGIDAYFLVRTIKERTSHEANWMALIRKALSYKDIYIIYHRMTLGGYLFVTLAFKPHYRYNWKKQHAERVK